MPVIIVGGWVISIVATVGIEGVESEVWLWMWLRGREVGRYDWLYLGSGEKVAIIY